MNKTLYHCIFYLSDIPLLSGQNVVNNSAGFVILITFYIFPHYSEFHLYVNDTELDVQDKTAIFKLPFLIYGQVVSLDASTVLIQVSNTGKYRYSIRNNYGAFNGTIDVWSDKTNSHNEGILSTILC